MNFNIELKNSVKESENLTYNTKERVKNFLEYNKALSGGSYGSGPADETAEACDFVVETDVKG